MQYEVSISCEVDQLEFGLAFTVTSDIDLPEVKAQALVIASSVLRDFVKITDISVFTPGVSSN